MQDNDLLNQAQLAALLGKSEYWVERCRWDGSGVPYVKIGRSVRYRRSDVDKFLSAHTRTWTRGEAGGGTPAAA
jgi:predicted DNA-binding transcriptional regulator AlpA